MLGASRNNTFRSFIQGISFVTCTTKGSKYLMIAELELSDAERLVGTLWSYQKVWKFF